MQHYTLMESVVCMDKTKRNILITCVVYNIIIFSFGILFKFLPHLRYNGFFRVQLRYTIYPICIRLSHRLTRFPIVEYSITKLVSGSCCKRGPLSREYVIPIPWILSTYFCELFNFN